MLSILYGHGHANFSMIVTKTLYGTTHIAGLHYKIKERWKKLKEILTSDDARDRWSR